MHPLWGLAITAFSPDGTRIVTGSSDKTVRLWDTAMWQPVGEPLWGHTHSVSSLSLSPDGTHIVTGSDDNTVRPCDAAMKRPSQQYAVSDPLAFSDEHHIMHPIESTNNMTLNNHFIRFSSNSIHALRNTSELTEGASHDDRSSTPFLLNRDSGWMMEHTCQMLFWVPPAPRHTFCSPQTALVIHRGGPELDLSSMAHGQHWQQCRDW
jgi:WD40 repeat protein